MVCEGRVRASWWVFWQGSFVFVAEGCIVGPLSEEMCVSYVENGFRLLT